jgi:hypothetical protein
MADDSLMTVRIEMPPDAITTTGAQPSVPTAAQEAAKAERQARMDALREERTLRRELRNEERKDQTQAQRLELSERAQAFKEARQLRNDQDKEERRLLAEQNRAEEQAIRERKSRIDGILSDVRRVAVGAVAGALVGGGGGFGGMLTGITTGLGGALMGMGGVLGTMLGGIISGMGLAGKALLGRADEFETTQAFWSPANLGEKLKTDLARMEFDIKLAEALEGYYQALQEAKRQLLADPAYFQAVKAATIASEEFATAIQRIKLDTITKLIESGSLERIFEKMPLLADAFAKLADAIPPVIDLFSRLVHLWDEMPSKAETDQAYHEAGIDQTIPPWASPDDLRKMQIRDYSVGTQASRSAGWSSFFEAIASIPGAIGEAITYPVNKDSRWMENLWENLKGAKDIFTPESKQKQKDEFKYGDMPEERRQQWQDAIDRSQASLFGPRDADLERNLQQWALDGTDTDEGGTRGSFTPEMMLA